MTPSLRRRARPLLGTLVEMAVPCRSDADFVRLTARAFARVQQFHEAMSRHRPTSDICRIAAARSGQTVAIGVDTYRVLAAALALERESDGMFDVAVAASGTCPSRRSAGESLRLAPGGGAVEVLAPVCIDLGGIAKGAAVDAAVEALRADGATQAIVNAGGDLAVLGDWPQPIAVRGPGGSRFAAGTLADGAIATSGPFGSTGGNALCVAAGVRALWIDRSVSVIAPRCIVADALTKVVAVLGQGAAPLLGRHGATAFSVDRHAVVEHVVPPEAVDRRGVLPPTVVAGRAWACK